MWEEHVTKYLLSSERRQHCSITAQVWRVVFGRRWSWGCLRKVCPEVIGGGLSIKPWVRREGPKIEGKRQMTLRKQRGVPLGHLFPLLSSSSTLASAAPCSPASCTLPSPAPSSGSKAALCGLHSRWPLSLGQPPLQASCTSRPPDLAVSDSTCSGLSGRRFWSPSSSWTMCLDTEAPQKELPL